VRGAQPRSMEITATIAISTTGHVRSLLSMPKCYPSSNGIGSGMDTSKRCADVPSPVKLPPCNRGDSTPIELFLEGVRVWEPWICRLLTDNAGSCD
jgi:hypothetical protein